jgi:hypothetical protein
VVAALKENSFSPAGRMSNTMNSILQITKIFNFFASSIRKRKAVGLLPLNLFFHIQQIFRISGETTDKKSAIRDRKHSSWCLEFHQKNGMWTESNP